MLFFFNKTLRNKYEIEGPLKLLMLSYNAIREYDIAEENLEFAMDVLELICYNKLVPKQKLTKY